MAISNKTRKTLWARSGNRCALCRKELVAERNEHNRNLNLGEECHIISEQLNGPRHIPNYEDGYDEYGNLILLCKNHHRTIDELWETYTADLLRTTKENHEKWVRTVLDNASSDKKTTSPAALPRLTSGKQIVDIIRDVAGYQFDHDNLDSQDDADYVSDFLQNLHDWGEISGSGVFEIGRQVQLGFDLNKDIEELERRGYFLFGERKRSRYKDSAGKDLGLWDIAVIWVMRKDNPAIVYK
jgi:hypothetical protein